jgi:hypothetical protein
MKRNTYTLSIICGIVLMPQLLLAAGSGCEGDECFFEEPSSRRGRREKSWADPKPAQITVNTSAEALSNPVSHPVKPQGKNNKKRSKKPQAKTQLVTVSSSVETRELPAGGNIPKYMMRHDLNNEHYSVGALVVNSKEILEKISGVRDGDVLYASLPQKIKASPQAATSIRVTLLSGTRRGSLLMGTATLDPELKRVFLTFNKFRSNEDDEVYALEAEGQNLDGERGIEGEYHTEEGKFFLASLVTGFLGVLADSSVNRNQTVTGGWTQEPSLSNSALTSAGATLVQQGSRLAQKAESAPQYTQTDGNQVIRVMIKSDPIRKL